jgi:hypothetical protein
MYDELEPEPFSEQNTDNATKFHSLDIDEKQYRQLVGKDEWEVRKQWLRFHGYNQGTWNGAWANKEKLYQIDNDAVFDAIAGQIELSRYQRQRGKILFRRIDFPKYSPYYTVTDIAFYVCVLVANEDYRGKGRIYHPNKKHYKHKIGIDSVGNPQDVFIGIATQLNLDIPENKINAGLEKFRKIIGV